MIYINSDIYTMLERTKGKTLICFGAGKWLKEACRVYSDALFFDKVDYIVDNDDTKDSFEYSGTEKKVIRLADCLKQKLNEPVILVTVMDCFDIIKQLDSISELNNYECYIYAFARSVVKPYDLPKNRAMRETVKIPKTIHYCWFGGKPIPDRFNRCIESWERYCPDYEIVRWDERNYDFKKNEYMYEAYKHEAWGFVPDYARLDIIYNYGGVYLDTDVELIRNIDDLLCDDAFCGFNNPSMVANGLGFGAVASFPLIIEQREEYEKLSFLDSTGNANLTPGPIYQTTLFQSKGLKLDNTLQAIQGMTIYPSDVLSPLSAATGILNKTNNSYAIHNHALTWLDDDNAKVRKHRMDSYKKLYRTLFLQFNEASI